MPRKTINPDSVFNTVRAASTPVRDGSLQYGFSLAVISSGVRLHISGQVGVDADERIAGPDLESQTRTAIDNLEMILEEAGGNLQEEVMLRIYLVESVRDDQAPVGRALRERFPIDPPASSWIIVSGLSEPEWLVEIEAEAVLDSTLD